MAEPMKVAVVGAASLVGREVVGLLGERGFPLSELVPVDVDDTETVELGGEELPVRKAEPAALAGVGLALVVAGERLARELVPAITAAGGVVVDASGAWRADAEVPLVVPEVNGDDLAGFAAKRMVASPGSAAVALAVATAPLAREAGLERLVVSTYESVSGSGQPGMDELGTQVRALFNQRDVVTEVFPRRVAFNCLPQVGPFGDGGFTADELALADESRRVLHTPGVQVCVTRVRVPMFNGQALSVLAELERPLEVDRARALLREAPGVMLMDDAATGHYPTPADAEGTDATFVGRLRRDPSSPRGLAYWCVLDNVRKGVAANVVQIAELLARDYL